MSRLETVEHRQGRLGAVLRKRRVHVVAWIVLIEGLLVLFGAIPWWTVFVLAAVAIGLYVVAGRASSQPFLRESTWIAAVSQVVVVLVPVVAVVLTTLAVIALVVVAAGALVLLLRDRR